MELHVGEMSAHVKMTTDVLCCPSSRDCMASAALCFIKPQKSVLLFLVCILNQRLTSWFREDRPLVFSTCYPLKQKAM